MRTTQSSQYWTRTQEPSHRYPIPLPLRYKVKTKFPPLYRFGQTTMMSSKDIIFGSGGDELQPGMKAEIAVAWPFLLHGNIRLQLVIEASIIGSQDGVTEARILAYHFRTRGPPTKNPNVFEQDPSVQPELQERDQEGQASA